MRRLLVTGGAGFIGCNFVRYWRRRHRADTLVVLDALTYAGRRDNLDGVADLRFVHGDIRDTALVAALLADEKLDTVVHFAAESHVDRSIACPAEFISTNVEGTHSLLMAAKQAWLDRGSGRPHRFHHISTDEVYGSLGPSDPAFTEESPYRPSSPYAASKAASDHLVRAYARTYGLATTITGCSNNFGPYQYPEKLIPLFVTNALRGEPLPIYGDGQQVRDWLHVEDHCRGIELALMRGRPGETYNLGGGTELTNLEVADLICAAVDRLAGRPDGSSAAQLKTFVADRPGHDRRYAIDATKARSELGFAPESAFEAQLEATVSWYLQHRCWWDGTGREA
jgi:dTDP-glucose 4,6-dehydratase